jgi:hypothetical protein
MFNNQTDGHLNFIECPHKFWIQKIWLRDPSRLPDYSESGRIVAFREEQLFVAQLLKNSTSGQLTRLDYDTLIDEIEDFSKQAGKPDNIMIPMPLYHSHVRRWMSQQIGGIRFGVQTYLRLKDGSEIPIHWLIKGLPQEHIIVYNKQKHGEWVFKPGNFTGVLSFDIRRNINKERLTLDTRTLSAYVTLDSNRARKFDITSVKEWH